MGSSVLVTGNAATALVAERDYLRNTAKLIAEANKSEGEALIPIHILYCSGMVMVKLIFIYLFFNPPFFFSRVQAKILV
jgi:hypothetical protein